MQNPFTRTVAQHWLHETPFKPRSLFRITDSSSFTKFDDHEGFNTKISSIFVPFDHRFTPAFIKDYFEWSSLPEWLGLFSLSGTQKKAEREVAWRQSHGRKNIMKYEVCLDRLSWKELPWNWTTLWVLTDIKQQVMIFKATELIEKLGLRGKLKQKAELGATDEWIALEWIPRDMVVWEWQFS